VVRGARRAQNPFQDFNFADLEEATKELEQQELLEFEDVKQEEKQQDLMETEDSHPNSDQSFDAWGVDPIDAHIQIFPPGEEPSQYPETSYHNVDEDTSSVLTQPDEEEVLSERGN
jgi:hypothetical protein